MCIFVFIILIVEDRWLDQPFTWLMIWLFLIDNCLWICLLVNVSLKKIDLPLSALFIGIQSSQGQHSYHNIHSINLVFTIHTVTTFYKSTFMTTSRHYKCRVVSVVCGVVSAALYGGHACHARRVGARATLALDPVRYVNSVVMSKYKTNNDYRTWWEVNAMGY